MSDDNSDAYPPITDEEFLQWRELYHNKILGSIKRWSMARAVLYDDKLIATPGELIDIVNEFPHIDRDHTTVANNHTWKLLDVLGISTRITERLGHGTRGLRMRIPHITHWISQAHGIPTTPPEPADFRPTDEEPIEWAVAEQTRIARRVLRYAAQQAVQYDTNDALREAPSNIAFNGLLLAYVAEECEIFDNGRVDTFSIESEPSDELTGSDGDIRHLDIAIKILADRLRVENRGELKTRLMQVGTLIAKVVSYDVRTQPREEGDHDIATKPAFQDGGGSDWLNWQASVQATPSSVERENTVDSPPVVSIEDDAGEITIDLSLRNIRVN